MEKENILAQYISIWGWHLLGMQFLIGSFILIAMSRDMINFILFLVFLLMFMICEIMSIKRKTRLYDE